MISALSLAVLAVLLTSCVVIVNCCSCIPVHPQKAYCTADYVIKARVKEKILVFDESDNTTDIPEEIKYVLKTRKLFKTSQAYEEINDTIHAYSPGTGGICGINLEVGEDYLISGEVRDGRLSISYCDWIVKYDQMTPHQMRGVRYVYKHGCGCDVYRCIGEYGCMTNPNPNPHCVWNRGLPGDCFTQVGVCKMNTNTGQCCWKRTKASRRCRDPERDYMVNWCPM